MDVLEVARRLIGDLKKLTVPNVPSCEYDLHNVVYVYLKNLGYDVKYLGYPGRRSVVDFIINGKLGLEVKYVGKSIDLDKVVGQCVRYRSRFGLYAVILYIYSLGDIKVSLQYYVNVFRNENIVPVFIKHKK